MLLQQRQIIFVGQPNNWNFISPNEETSALIQIVCCCCQKYLLLIIEIQSRQILFRGWIFNYLELNLKANALFVTKLGQIYFFQTSKVQRYFNPNISFTKTISTLTHYKAAVLCTEQPYILLQSWN